MNKFNSACRLLMKFYGKRFKDIAPFIISDDSLSKIYRAQANVSKKTLDRFDQEMGGVGLVHFCHLLDRLYVAAGNCGVHINPEGIILPDRFPADFRDMLKNEHPIFTGAPNMAE